MSEEMESVKMEDLPSDENSIKDKLDKKKRKKSPSGDAGQDESEESTPRSKSKPRVKLFEPEILEGKREKKTIQRLDLMSKPKEKLKIESTGRGDKLGDIARINHSIGKLKAPLLKPLHKIVYDRPGTASTLRKNLRLFNGFSFENDSDLYNKKMEKIKRLPKGMLKTICQTLDLERSGTQTVLSERIMKFLLQPTNSGKPVLKKKKKTTKDAKREKSSSKSKKPQKKVESGKSKPIVTDSSSDDDDDDDDDDDEEEEEESKENSKGTEKSVIASQKHNDTEDKSDTENDEDEDDGDSKEDSKEEEKAPPRKKTSTVKSTKKSAKKSDQTTSDDSDEEFHEDKNVKKTKKKPAAKRKAPAKPVPKTNKADSSSNRNKKTANKKKDESESSDDDLPLIKMIKKPPTDDQLKETIQDLLKDTNLEEVTMKQITRQVYDKYPDFDLTSRKEFIRESVKSLIS